MSAITLLETLQINFFLPGLFFSSRSENETDFFPDLHVHLIGVLLFFWLKLRRNHPLLHLHVLLYKILLLI